MEPIEELAAGQAGLVSAAQMCSAGVTWSRLRSQLAALRWQRIHHGVYRLRTGPLTDQERVWAAVLWAGDAAVLCHSAAEWLWGLRPDLPAVVTVSVPHGWPRPADATGVRIVQSRRLPSSRHPARRPPVTTLEDTVLDLVHAARTERPVIDIVLRACQQRLTTPRRLAAAAAARRRLRWRALLRDLLVDVRDGVTTPLERRYVRDVERAHGLPNGVRNRGEGPSGRRRYRDVRYRRWRLVVELDGRAAHPEEERERDDLRDNEVALRGERTLRYGWRSTTGMPCEVAAQAVRLLRAGGWSGTPVACRPGCPVGKRPQRRSWRPPR
nr:hypothetical protein [Geodermatophilaceae bacterium]